MSSSTTPVAEPDVLWDTGSSLRLLPLPLLRLTPPHGQHASPEAGSPASLPLLVIGHSCICRGKGGLDAETEELVDGDPRPGPAGSARCDPVVARQRLHGEASEQRAPPSQASAWSWPAAGIEEEGGIDGGGRRTLDAVGDPYPEGASPSPPAVLRDARHRTHALRGGGDCGEARTEAKVEEADNLRQPGPSAAPTPEPHCPVEHNELADQQHAGP